MKIAAIALFFVVVVALGVVGTIRAGVGLQHEVLPAVTDSRSTAHTSSSLRGA